jgi:hypothetical protein
MRYYQSRRNMFNSSTVIAYSLPASSNVSLEITNAPGLTVATFVDCYKDAGNYSTRFDAGKLPGGMYVCSLEANGAKLSRKMTLIK